MNHPIPQGVTPPTTGLDKEEPELVNEEDIPTDRDPESEAIDIGAAPPKEERKSSA